MRGSARAERFRLRSIHVLCRAADWFDMDVSAVSGSPSSYQSPAVKEAERIVLVVKKQQDVSQQQGQALVDLVESSSEIGQRINVLA